MLIRRLMLVLLILLLPFLSACDALDTILKRAAMPELLRVEVLNTYPHDATAYTQGLLVYNGQFYESAGRYAQSSLRLVEIETGRVLRQVAVPAQYFAEGLALVDDKLIQITWREASALVYQRDDFQPVQTFTYQGEGWGLCYDGEHLYMSDGSANLTVRDPNTFAPLRTLLVTGYGQPIVRLNELECVGDSVYANIWFSDLILKIDKKTGAVTAIIEASNLLQPQEQAVMEGGAVLNGIAYHPERGTFFITGKLWPKVFEVRFVPQ
ncbi:MAG: glutaminyl-peptide cyclotransferase [Anaerolinea sp.]|nr:glutaminyl-peptide cyclotransferase [Anaerolinea sp.]MCC6973952.1 glutaminyl-peptide cyclotransferase [Anaerolineae bacterium]CAG1003191.1 hypothetical protein ANRL4_03336 [Anaerolineae bacterium]